MYIDQITVEGIRFNLFYNGDESYHILEGNKPTDLNFKASTQAEALDKFQLIMEAYK